MVYDTCVLTKKAFRRRLWRFRVRMWSFAVAWGLIWTSAMLLVSQFPLHDEAQLRFEFFVIIGSILLGLFTAPLYVRRLERKLGLICPVCGKGLAHTVKHGKCGWCSSAVFTSPPPPLVVSH